MLTDISWKDYLTVAAISISLYYLFVGLRYFYPEIRGIFSPKGRTEARGGLLARPEQEMAADQGTQDEAVSIETYANDDFEQAEHLIERLKLAMACSPADKVEKVELEQCLRLMFRDYPSIRNSALRFSINELVASESEKNGTAPLGQEEVDELWQEAGQ